MNESRTTIDHRNSYGVSGASTSRPKKVILPSSSQGRQYVFTKDQQHLLGKGSFAKVYRGVMVVQERVAIKHIRMDKIEKHRANLEEEIRIMRGLRHKNIVNLLDVVDTEGQMFLIMEHCKDGDLKKYIDRKQMYEGTLQRYLRQLKDGLKYLHERNIMHRDLKPHNLLLTDNRKTLKISDFGFAKSMTSEQSMAQTMCGTPYYMAPEIMQNKKYLSKADLWSVGIIMYEMAYGMYPYKDVSGPFDLRDKIEKIDIVYPSYPEETDNELSEDALDLLKALLQKDPTNRISWEEFFTHPWLNPELQVSVSAPSLTASISPPRNQNSFTALNPQSPQNPQHPQHSQHQQYPQNPYSKTSPSMPIPTQSTSAPITGQQTQSTFSLFQMDDPDQDDDNQERPGMPAFTPTNLNSLTGLSPFLSQTTVPPKPFLDLVSNYRSTTERDEESSIHQTPTTVRSEPILVKRHPQYEDEDVNPNEESTLGTLRDYSHAAFKLAKDSLKSFHSLH